MQIVEFYAPWCGHCQNLKPAYEKAAKSLQGIAKVAAIDCDDDANKQLCGSMGVKGFPTLKIIRPRGKKPTVEDYNGQRTAAAIADAVVSSLNNHVKKVTDKDIESFLKEKNDTAKALLFTDKGTTSGLMKALAIDFLDVITIGQVRNKEKKAVETFGINKFPTLVLLPGGDKDAVVYEGEMKKDAIVKFLSQAGEPNPDPAPVKGKAKKEKKSSSSSSTKAKSQSASAESASASTETPEEAPTQAQPVIVKTAIPIPAIDRPEKLTKECLTAKSKTCFLAIVPSTHGENAKQALTSLSEIAHKHSSHGTSVLPMYEVAKENEAATGLVKALSLSAEVEIIAVNARRGWWRRYEGSDFGLQSLEAWMDAIRLGEGAKNKLPRGLVAVSQEESSSQSTTESAPEATPEEEVPQPTPEATVEAPVSEEAAPVTPEADISDAEPTEATATEATEATEPTPEVETAAGHDEL